MAKKISILKLSKQYGVNSAGEVCGFSPETAAHIIKHDGGALLAEIDPKLERYDVATAKVISTAPKAK